MSEMKAPPTVAPLARYLAAFYAAWIGRVLLYRPLDLSIESEPGKRLVAWSFFLGLMALPAVLYVRYVDRQPPLAYLRLTTNVGKGVAWGVLASLAYFLLHYLVFGLALGHRMTWPVTLLNSPLSLPTLSEEILFRGFVLRKLEERLPFWKANLVQAALFVLVHWPGWLIAVGYPVTRAAALSVPIFVLALLLGLLVRRTDALWGAVLLHATNNLMVQIGLAP